MAITKPPPQERRRNEWIYTDTWLLVDTKVVSKHTPKRYKRLLRYLGVLVGVILKEYLRRHTATASMEVEALLASYTPLVKEAWTQIQVCYYNRENRPPLPERVTIE